jgi:hypothetical protein
VARDWRDDRSGIYDAADRFVDEYLRSDGSMFTPGVEIACASELPSRNAIRAA